MLTPTIHLDPEACARVGDTPFRHAVFAESTLLPARLTDRLVAEFPDPELLTPNARAAGSDKTYSLNNATLYLFGRWTPEAARLTDLWRELAGHLVESDYPYRLGRLLGVPAGPLRFELRVVEYRRGGWMSRHTDRPDKVYSQNLYFCPGWDPRWGGGLALYDRPAAADPVATFVPGAGTSVAFARSDTSWHEVLPVSDDAPRPRRALLLHAYRT